jgi:hypothetical protein
MRILTTAILALAVISTKTQAQRIDIYLGPTNPSTVTISNTDTTTLNTRVYSSSGSRVLTPNAITWRIASHCLASGAVSDSGKILNGFQWIARPGCVVPTGYVVATTTVSGFTVRDSVLITPIPETTPTSGSAMAICLAGASQHVTSSSNGWGTVLAIDGATQRIPAIDSSVWPAFSYLPKGAIVQMQVYAYMCGPGWQAFEYTRNINARWSTTNSTAASISATGLLTIRQPAGWGVTADYRWP